MNSFMTRRQLLAVAAGSILANPVTYAATHLLQRDVVTPRIVRRMASWNEQGSLSCWVECRDDTVDHVVFDMQSIFSERAVVRHLDFQDLELLLRPHTALGIPLLQAGCAAHTRLETAVETAFMGAGRHKPNPTGKMRYAGLVLVSAPDGSEFLSSIKGIHSWLSRHFQDDVYYGIQYLVDPSLATASKRVSVVVAG